MAQPKDFEEGCNCINCRLARMESQITKMQQDLSKLCMPSSKR
jgi:hypothetical protein